MALVSAPQHDEWNTLELLPYDGSIIGKGEIEGEQVVPGQRHGLSKVAGAVEGDPANELTDLLNRTEPDELALKYWDLPGEERWTKVSE
ncbi:hypothetical protein AB0I66_41780 [Streptomyces sp. NPDC050439]|uniref:hypothetical protein n=1 Tax=unclassified Streptomyces TaxID=2593676 RepID=UPI003435F061